MKICLLSEFDTTEDPRARVLWHTLHAAGHDVSSVRIRSGHRSLVHRIVRRLLGGKRVDRARVMRRLRRLRPDLLHPTSLAAVPYAVAAAERMQIPIAGSHTWPSPGNWDYVWVAPRRPEMVPQSMMGAREFHTPADKRPVYSPEVGRHAGRRVAVYHRSWRQSPGEHVTAALVRAGVDVVKIDRLDWDSLGSVDGVFITESPLPALEVRGENPGIPVAYWVHHGELHLHANRRLIERYGVHHLLLAHSWHLAYRFSVPVHRFPFAVAQELIEHIRPNEWQSRSFDAAFVGVSLRSGGGYARRQEIVASIEQGWPSNRLAFREGIDRAEMMRTYADARVVLNDVGLPHYKLTDRVFEAFGAGAVLLTDPPPGLDVLFTPGEDYVELRESPLDDLKATLADPERAAEIARRGHERAMGRHTYDHRVDELFEIIDGGITAVSRSLVPLSPLARLIATDVDAHRIVACGDDLLAAELPDRELWPVARVRDRLRQGSYDAAVVAAVDGDLDEILEAARKFVYSAGEAVGPVTERARTMWPDAEIAEVSPGLIRIDRFGEGYRMPR